MSVEGAEDDVGQPMGFQQTPEFEEGGGIRCGFAQKVNADEAADGLAVVKGVFDAFIRKPEAVLGDVHPQHALQANGRTTRPATGRVERGDGNHQRSPGSEGFDVGQKPIPTGLLLLGRVLKLGKATLHGNISVTYCHHWLLSHHTRRQGVAEGRINQWFPSSALNNGEWPFRNCRRADQDREAAPVDRVVSGGRWEQRPSGIERYPLSCHECMRDFRLSDPCRNQGLRSQKASFKMLKQT